MKKLLKSPPCTGEINVTYFDILYDVTDTECIRYQAPRHSTLIVVPIEYQNTS